MDRIHPGGRGVSLEKTPVAPVAIGRPLLDCRVGGGKTKMVRWDLEPEMAGPMKGAQFTTPFGARPYEAPPFDRSLVCASVLVYALVL